MYLITLTVVGLASMSALAMEGGETSGQSQDVESSGAHQDSGKHDIGQAPTQGKHPIELARHMSTARSKLWHEYYLGADTVKRKNIYTQLRRQKKSPARDKALARIRDDIQALPVKWHKEYQTEEQQRAIKYQHAKQIYDQHGLSGLSGDLQRKVHQGEPLRSWRGIPWMERYKRLRRVQASEHDMRANHMAKNFAYEKSQKVEKEKAEKEKQKAKAEEGTSQGTGGGKEDQSSETDHLIDQAHDRVMQKNPHWLRKQHINQQLRLAFRGASKLSPWQQYRMLILEDGPSGSLHARI